MDLTPIERLLSRRSHSRLSGEAPSKQQLKILFQAALRAPDHAQLKPWRFLVFSGDSLLILGEHFVNAAQQKTPDLSEQKLARIRAKATRAPMVIVAISHLKEHPKVPHIEQLLSAGASVQNLIMAAHFLSIGAIWRTGSLAFNAFLCDQLGLDSNESIVGFIYLGHEDGQKKSVPEIDQAAYVTWV